MSKEPRGAVSRMPIFVDADVGCDDAVALAWLLRQPEAQVVGLSSVFGNSSVQNTTANLLTLLELLGSDVPVAGGASAPLVCLRTSAGALVHGPDGLWGNQQPYDLETLSWGAPGAIAAAAHAYPGLTLIALGPLTNVARAVQAYPEEMAGVRLVALVGAHGAGNITPAAEFNAFADPHALSVVLESQLNIELVTRDAFQELCVDVALTRTLEREGGRAGAFLARVLDGYYQARARPNGTVAIPDAAAVIYALYPHLGVGVPATVRVVTEGELTRGQTLLALSKEHQATLALGVSGVEQLARHIGAPGFDFEAALQEAIARAPHNARVVLSIDAQQMGELLTEGLMSLRSVRVVGG